MAEGEDLVVVISGASRGIGRGIAHVFGARGATVYVAGRSRQEGATHGREEAVLPGTIDAVAAEVTGAGGKGIPVVCDMADDAQIAALFDRVRAESGHVDILVNNAAFLHNDMGKPGPWWESSVRLADIIDIGLRCHYVATHAAVPLMLGRGRGLIVNISFYSGAKMHDPAYYAAKAGLDAFAATAAPDLAAHGIGMVSLWPGLVTTERVQIISEQMPSLKERLSSFESPEFTGKVIAAIYDDPELAALSGKTVIGAEMADRYGFTDEDGRRPPSYREAFGGPRPEHDLA